MNNRSASLRAGLLPSLLLAGCSIGLAHADEGVPGDQWRFQATPYVWMSSLDGTVKPFRSAPAADVNKSFSELMDSLDAAAFLTATARRGRFVLQGDLTHASTSDSTALPLGLSARVKVRQSSATVTAGYAVEVSEDSSIDVMAGLRYWDIDAAVDVPGLLSTRSGSRFIDPIAAARWRQTLGPRWSSVLYADVGGFGVGSDATWQIVALANYQATAQVFVSAGYRHQSLDYGDNGKRLDMSLSGPMLGVTYVF